MKRLAYGRYLAVALLGLLGLAQWMPGHTREFATIELGGEKFRVELATTEEERRRGLQNRPPLGPNEGMLFVYERPQPVRFWNKDVRFAIDILYFDEAKKLIAVDLDVPACAGAECPIYETEAAIKYVLEVSAGTVSRLELESRVPLGYFSALGAIFAFGRKGKRQVPDDCVPAFETTRDAVVASA